MHCCHPPKPHHPPCPAPPQGYLMQKIIACEKRSFPCLSTEWCFDACASGSIQSVVPCGAPAWAVENGCTLQITLPVSVRLRDACGHSCAYQASIALQADLPHRFLEGLDDPRNMLLILPCVRLVHAECACGGCYRVKLSASLEICLLRYETLYCGAPKPACPPPLPLYPQPLC
ncbi:MAG: hypothetical protein IKU70_09450 [Clostridia bacterium]|nr:hypothetical protein [Clostridia bacterium]